MTRYEKFLQLRRTDSAIRLWSDAAPYTAEATLPPWIKRMWPPPPPGTGPFRRLWNSSTSLLALAPSTSFRRCVYRFTRWANRVDASVGRGLE